MEELLRLIGYCMGVAALSCFALAWFAWPKNKRLSPKLHQFLCDWYVWATTGAPELKPFSRAEGLCIAAYRDKNYDKIARELEELLWNDFECASYPFGKSDYIVRDKNHTQHLCPKRLAWVAEKIGV